MSNSADENTPRSTEYDHLTLMHKVLEATLARREGSLSEAEWSRLRQVAGELHSRAASTVEFVENLIWTLCELRLPVLLQDAATCRNMCHRLAATLAADPYARKRISEFQNHLMRPAS